jgi:hypothetical protein
VEQAPTIWAFPFVYRTSTFRHPECCLLQIRFFQTFLDTYEAEGWRKSNVEKVKPHSELFAAQRGIVDAKRKIRAILAEIGECGAVRGGVVKALQVMVHVPSVCAARRRIMYCTDGWHADTPHWGNCAGAEGDAANKWVSTKPGAGSASASASASASRSTTRGTPRSTGGSTPRSTPRHGTRGATAAAGAAACALDDGIPAEDIACSKCGSPDADSDDDILLCDYAGCGRAFHQRCCEPPVTADAMPADDEDWVCHRVRTSRFLLIVSCCWPGATEHGPL